MPLYEPYVPRFLQGCATPRPAPGAPVVPTPLFMHCTLRSKIQVNYISYKQTQNVAIVIIMLGDSIRCISYDAANRFRGVLTASFDYVVGTLEVQITALMC